MLDPQGKADINQLIHELHDEKKLTIISITHDIEEVAKSDYVIVMDQGHVVMQGKPEEILKHEEELIRLKLDIPNALKFRNELRRYGIETKKVLTLERLVEEVCQLKSKI